MIKSSVFRPGTFSLLALLPALACGSGGKQLSPYPYKAGTTQVIGSTNSGGAFVNGAAGHGAAGAGSDQPESISTGMVGVSSVGTFSTPTTSEGCIQLDGQCLKPQKDCGTDGTADVIVGAQGETLSTICYPNRGYQVVNVGDAPAAAPKVGNNTVVVLDDKNDGVDIQGDLSITGNNAIIYGHGPDVSVIGGNLAIDKNNAIVRGVRIQGDASISKNNASLIDCVIEGNLSISGNNVNLALCQIWGTVSITGQNAVFVSNLVEGTQSIEGDNLRCNDNHSFTDQNADGTVQSSEIGDPISCVSRGQTVPDTSKLPKK